MSLTDCPTGPQKWTNTHFQTCAWRITSVSAKIAAQCCPSTSPSLFSSVPEYHTPVLFNITEFGGEFDARGVPCYEACANKIEDREIVEVKTCLVEAGLGDTVCRSLQDAIDGEGEGEGGETMAGKMSAMREGAGRMNKAASLLGVVGILVAVLGASV